MSLKKIGKFLSTERKRQRKSVSQVSEITRISLKRLREVEEGYRDPKLAQVYFYGYIKSYAQCLNIDYNRLAHLLYDADEKDSKNLKLTEPKKIGKVLTPLLNITNISMVMAVCVFSGLIGWTRVMIEKYEVNLNESSLQRNLSQIPFQRKNLCDEQSSSHLKSECKTSTEVNE